MDEPLASLDAARKAEILPYLTRLKTALRLPVLYVTHDLDEVARLADSMVLIEAGRVVGFGPLAEVAARADLPLARATTPARCCIAASPSMTPAANSRCLDAGGVRFWVPLLDAPVGGECRIRIPAREVILAGRAPEAISLHNIIPGTVRRIAARSRAARGDGGDRAAGWRVAGAGHAGRHRPAGVGAGRAGPGADQVHIDRGAWRPACRGVALQRYILIVYRVALSRARCHESVLHDECAVRSFVAVD